MPAATVDEYLGVLPPGKRSALERLRARIRELVPDAVEGMSYGMPAFRLDGRYFLGLGATRDRCSFYTGRAPIDAHPDELRGYRTWKGTLNFDADELLPDELVTRLVEARLAEFRPG